MPHKMYTTVTFVIVIIKSYFVCSIHYPVATYPKSLFQVVWMGMYTLLHLSIYTYVCMCKYYFNGMRTFKPETLAQMQRSNQTFAKLVSDLDSHPHEHPSPCSILTRDACASDKPIDPFPFCRRLLLPAVVFHYVITIFCNISWPGDIVLKCIHLRYHAMFC